MRISKMDFIQLKQLFLVCCLIGGAISSDAKLRIMPESDGIFLRALGKPSIFTCVADVEIPEKLAEFRWWWPDGKMIEPTDSSEGYERVEILRDQPGTLTLLFSSVQDEDLGQYRCTATYALNQPMEANFTLRAFTPITFEDANEYQFAVKGKDEKIRCRVKANPPPEVDWKKDHVIINTHERTNLVVDSDGLLIRNVQESDEGIYTCRVRVKELGTVEERHIKVEVQEYPVIISDPVELEGVEEESVTFQCKATGKPAPEYDWVNVRAQELYASPRHVVDKYRGTLTIDQIHPEDSGTYRCTARNSAGHVTSTSRLFVVTKPIIEEFINVTAKIGESAVLTCRASGDPAPDIVFHKDSVREPFSSQGAQADSRIFTIQKKEGRITVAQIKVEPLLRTDDGLYKCIAFNTRTRTERDGHLTVEFPPTFANTPMKEQWAWEGNPRNLSCLAEAIPNATITWYVLTPTVEVPVGPSTQNMRQYGFQSNSSLEVLPISYDYYRSYKCVATNKMGTSEHLIQLREAKKPGQILQVIVQEKTATSISYRIVGPMDDGGLPLKSYVVEYREDRFVNWDEHTSIRKSFPVDQYVFIVENLEPLHTYYIRFAAENEVGIGHWAHERPETMPRRSAPEPPVILSESYNGVANTPYPDRFELRWSVPQDNGERIQAFEISYAPVRNYTIHKGAQEVFEWETIGQLLEEEKPLGEPRHVLRNLVPGAYYRVEIRARNVIGKSQPAQIIVRTASIPGADSSSYDLRRGESLQSLPMLIVIIGVVLLLILLFVDILCCRINQMGIIWAITHKLCHKKKSRESLVKNGNDAAIREKQPLADEGYRQHSHIIAPDAMKVNGNGNKNGQARDSEV